MLLPRQRLKVASDAQHPGRRLFRTAVIDSAGNDATVISDRFAMVAQWPLLPLKATKLLRRISDALGHLRMLAAEIVPASCTSCRESAITRDETSR